MAEDKSNSDNPFSGITSPLVEANSKSVDEIYNEDPELLTDQEFMFLINDYRKDRLKYLQDEIAGKTRGRKSTKQKSTNVSLKSLGLDI